MPVSVKNKSKKAGQEVVEKAPPLEEESAKKVDAFQSEMVGPIDPWKQWMPVIVTLINQHLGMKILGSPQKQRFKKKACQMVRTHVKLVVEEDIGSLAGRDSAGRRRQSVPRSGP